MIVWVVKVPFIVPGLIVQLPVFGKLENWIDPVLVVQLGWITFRVGVVGLLFTVTRTVAVLEHPLDPCPLTV